MVAAINFYLSPDDYRFWWGFFLYCVSVFLKLELPADFSRGRTSGGGAGASLMLSVDAVKEKAGKEMREKLPLLP